MTEEQLIQEIGKPILRPLGFLQLIALSALFSSPFIWIWYSWDLAWKVGLTGFLTALLIGWFGKFCKKTILENIKQAEKELERKSPKSRFQERLKKLLEEQN